MRIWPRPDQPIDLAGHFTAITLSTYGQARPTLLLTAVMLDIVQRTRKRLHRCTGLLRRLQAAKEDSNA
jgi:hypothetical protein